MNRLTRILPVVAGMLGAILSFGCSSELAGPSDPAFGEARMEPVMTLTPCDPQPTGTTGRWIGPKGGVLKAGKHTLVIPPKALKEPTWITMKAPSGTINRVALTPDGLTFKVPAQLGLSYANCWLKPDAKQLVVYINDQLVILETTPSESDPLSQTVYGTVTHFSDYALSTYAVVY